MSRLEDTPPDVLAILAALCDDTATQQDMDKLEALIGNDREAVAMVLDYLQMHSDLHFELTSRKASANVFRGIRLVDDPADLFYRDLLFSYAVATVVVGIGLLIAAHTPVSHYTQLPGNASVASNTSTPAAGARAEPEMVFVGQVTGLIDCQWADPNTATLDRAFVPRGRRFALASGLMQITYDTGAKVILQGPCTYEVESEAGGFLSLGKLTARVEKKVASDQWPVANESKIRAPSLTTNHQPLATSVLSTLHSPLFTMKTPTATVTDLGTEFAVNVERDGTNRVHVFQGKVELRRLAAMAGSADPILLGRGQSAWLAADGRSMSPSADEAIGNATAFIRRLPRSSNCIDLLDIVSGGDGAGTRRRHGIDPTNGADEPAFVSKSREGNGRYSPVSSQPMIDGVFVPNGENGPVQLDSAGHLFAGFPKTDGTALGSIWARDALGQPDGQMQKRRHWVCVIGPGDRYMPARRGLLCLNANAGVTFDLAEIRKSRPDDLPVRFHAIAGMTGRGTADVWVFVDGTQKYQRLALRHEDGPCHIGVILSPTDRFLTLAATDSDKNTSHDWIVLGDPVLQVASCREEAAR